MYVLLGNRLQILLMFNFILFILKVLPKSIDIKKLGHMYKNKFDSWSVKTISFHFVRL